METEYMKLIREELVLRVNALPEMNQKTNKSDFSSSFELTASHLANTPTFAQKITATRDKILEDRGIVLSEAERKVLRQFLKPTQTELLKKYMNK